MSLQNPYEKPYVFMMVNSSLDTTLDADDYVIGTPQIQLSEFNTKILIRPTLKSSIYGRNYFSYNRFDFENLQPIELIYQNEQTLLDLIPKINQLTLFDKQENSPIYFLDQLGLPYIGETEVLDKPIPPIGSNNQTYVMMVARPNSYIYTGQIPIKLTKA